MKVRGTRECQSCGTQWSYYATGRIECPNCGSMRSVGVDEERSLHTASPATLELSPVRDAVDDRPLREVAELAVETTREFTRRYGFVDGGRLQPLADTYVAATELRTVADAVARTQRLSEDEELYFLSLLRGADQDERPSIETVPESLRASRGLAYANAVEAYRSDVRAYLDEEPDATVGTTLGLLRTHVKRALAIDGDVPLATSEALVQAARDIGRAIIEDDEGALAEAEARLDGLA